MGKHNGKARKTGKAVGSALVNKARKDGKIGHADSYLYTTDTSRDRFSHPTKRPGGTHVDG